ncbi:hypothetical protein PENTCL1PPCAC_13484, partial [Pristionchus entomophagus]
QQPLLLDALRFANSGTDSFANAAVNVLLSFNRLVEDFPYRPTGANIVVDLLIEALHRRQIGPFVPKNLRALARFSAFAQGQHDPAEFLKEVILSLDEAMMEDFLFDVEYTAECVSGCKKSGIKVSAEDYMLVVSSFENSSAMTIEEHVKAGLEANFNSSPFDHSADCSKREVKKMQAIVRKMPRYLIITPQTFTKVLNASQPDLLRNVIYNDEITIYGRRYEIVSAIHYASLYEGGSGHYESWRKIPEGWSVADEHHVYFQSHVDFREKMLDFCVIAFEAI